MDLSAILNTPSTVQQHPLSPMSGDSSPADTIRTPRTPMDTSPEASCTSQSPEGSNRRDDWRQQHVRGASDGWRRSEFRGEWNDQEQSEVKGWSRGQGPVNGVADSWRAHRLDWTSSEPVHGRRLRRQTYACQGSDRVVSPSEDMFRGGNWAVGTYHEIDHRERERLPSVHELFPDSVPYYSHSHSYRGPSASFSAQSTQSTQEPYDSDATISDADSTSPGPTDLSPSTPVSPSSLPLCTGTSFAGSRVPFLPTKPRCAFVPDCTLPAPPRRIVSHYFGRNKKETRAIPESVWVFYCRQHYQRAKYRQRTHVYAQTQMRLVRQTVENLEAWGGVTDFAINLRKRAVLQLKKEDESTKRNARSSHTAATTTETAHDTGTDERWLVPFTGPHKSFAEVYDVINRVAERSRVRQCPAAEFELVPNIRPEFMRRARD